MLELEMFLREDDEIRWDGNENEWDVTRQTWEIQRNIKYIAKEA